MNLVKLVTANPLLGLTQKENINKSLQINKTIYNWPSTQTHEEEIEKRKELTKEAEKEILEKVIERAKQEEQEVKLFRRIKVTKDSSMVLKMMLNERYARKLQDKNPVKDDEIEIKDMIMSFEKTLAVSRMASKKFGPEIRKFVLNKLKNKIRDSRNWAETTVTQINNILTQTQERIHVKPMVSEIVTCKHIESVSMVKDNIVFVTKEITLECKEFGKFYVKIPMKAVKSKNIGQIQLIALTPNSCQHTENIVHPHVNTCQLCFGEAVASANTAMQRMDFVSLASIIMAILTTYNNKNPYAKIESFGSKSGLKKCTICLKEFYKSEMNMCIACALDEVKTLNTCDNCASKFHTKYGYAMCNIHKTETNELRKSLGFHPFQIETLSRGGRVSCLHQLPDGKLIDITAYRQELSTILQDELFRKKIIYQNEVKLVYNEKHDLDLEATKKKYKEEIEKNETQSLINQRLGIHARQFIETLRTENERAIKFAKAYSIPPFKFLKNANVQLQTFLESVNSEPIPTNV